MNQVNSNKDISLLSENENKPLEMKDIAQASDCNKDFDEGIEEKKTFKNKETKEYNTNTLLLNSYWIELVSKGAFGFSILFYEIVGYYVFMSFSHVINGNFNDIKEFTTVLLKDIGLKWLIIVKVNQNLSKGFFCLINFTKILKNKNNLLKFFITNFIKSIVFYFLSIIIMKYMIEMGVFETIINEIKKQDVSQNIKDITLELIEDLKKITIRSVGNLLGDYNNSLDKLVIGSLYVIFFSSPKCIKKKYLIFLRLLSILPISYIILSFVFRSLNNSGVVNLSLFITPIFVGNKITIFGFFIAFILYLKYKEKRRYKMIDEEGNILPSVFAKVSSIIFAFFGLVEFYVGLFHPDIAKYGIGNNYLIILCAPIMILYDYKKDYELRIKPCKNNNLGTCVNISTSIFYME